MPHIRLTTGVPLDFAPQTLAEFGRAKDDYEWFAARFIPIADKEADAPHPLFLNASQQYLKWYIETFQNEYGGGNFLIYKGRQFGCSTFIDTILAHQALKGPGFQAFIFAHETAPADNLLNIVRRPYWALPDGYQLPDGTLVSLKPEGKHRQNKKELWVYFDGDLNRDSHVLIEEATAGATAGVSYTANAIHFSEVGKAAFDDGLAVGTSMQALSRSAMVFAEGTANGAYGWMYNIWQEAWPDFQEFKKAHKKNPELRYSGWVPIFLPWFWHYGYPGGLRFPLAGGEVIEPQSEWEEGAISGDTTYLHYRCTPENIKAMRYLWENRIKTAASDAGLSAEEYRAQEYPSNPEEGFIQTGATFFAKEVLGTGLTFSREWMRTHEVQRYEHQLDGFQGHRYGELYMLKEPEPERFKYVIGGDVASGRDKDWDVNVIIEIRADSPNIVIGYWRAHQDDKYVHAILTRDLAEWCKASVVAVENDKFGVAVNDHLSGLRCRGLYVGVPEDEGSFRPGYRKEYGWNPSHKSRGIMLGQLQAVTRKWYEKPGDADGKNADPDGLIIPFPEIWNEMQAFVKMKGKMEATVGAHDDLVMALAIANSVALDIAPKKAAKPVNPMDKTIRHYKAAGIKSAVRFYERLKKAGKGAG